jgi:putative tryptophan/tyrosine transport system substrate-binding protein
MRRRKFIKLLGAVAATWPPAAQAQHAERTARLGILAAYDESDALISKRIGALKQRLQELGWSEATNLRIETRFAGSDDSRLRSAAAELVSFSPEAIVSTNSTTTRILLEANTDIPIVAAISGDPIALDFTKSLSKPTRNVTGFTTFNDTLAGKRFEMLREVVPAMRKAGVLWVQINPQQQLLEKQTEKAAEGFGIELLSLPVSTASDIVLALAKAESQKAAAIIVASDPLLISNHRAIIEACLVRKLPAMHTYAVEAENGALIAYGVDLLDNYRRTAEYVDRILRGAKIADLPFQEPTRLVLAINLKTAKVLGVTVPPSLLASADEVIE